MRTGSSEYSEAEIAERNERAKKLYRYVSDVARRIDEATAASHSVADLFTTYLEVQRQKLRDNCEKLMFTDPLSYGKKSLELLWRKVYYDTVSAAKKHQETDADCDNYLLTHILCGIGHLHHFITRIQSEMKVQFKELDYTPMYKDEESEEVEEVRSDNDLQLFGRSILHSCLIYLGDLSRYQAEIFHTFDPSMAARYYLQAAHIDLSSGMPYNQLGNLYLEKNHNLDSVCYYIQCLSCTVPFEGASGNLTKIFEKNNQFVESMSQSGTLTQAEHVQMTVANFLSLIEIWYLGKDESEIPQKCSLIAQQLKISMDFNRQLLPDMGKNYDEHIQAVEEENLNPSSLTGNIINKITQICLFTIAKMSEVDEKKAFACKAFTLALLSQLLQKLLHQLQDLGFKNPADNCRKNSITALDLESEKADIEKEEVVIVATPNDDRDVIEVPEFIEEDDNDETIIVEHATHTDAENELQNGDVKINSKKAIAKRRRRRRAASSDSSDISDAETESSDMQSDNSCSDSEVLSDSSYESENEAKCEGSMEEAGHGDVICSDKQNGNVAPKKEAKNNQINMNGDAKENGISKKGQLVIDDKIELNARDIQNFLRGENFLPSIKLLQDWVLTEKDLILSCGESGESLFQCVVNLLNIFTHYFKPNIANEQSCKILDYAKAVAKKLNLEYRTIPLPEDVNLRGTSICKFDKDAAEWQLLNRYKPSVYEENVIRILNFIDFGNQIAQIVPRIRFNRSMQILYLKKTPAPKLNTKISHKRNREWHSSKKQHAEGAEGGLLHRLGRLWLASRVRELERYGRSAAAPTLLALDAAALHKHLKRVKQLLKAKIFILLVPTIVLQELDDLKRDNSTARDAIRWLEVQLEGGSRFVRAQRPGQTRPLPLLKYPRKAPPHIHNYIQILEFCHHFVADDKNHGGNGDTTSKSTPLLVFLTGNEPGAIEDQYKEYSVTGAAHAAGVTVEYIGDFYTKWRQTVHKSGKKR